MQCKEDSGGGKRGRMRAESEVRQMRGAGYKDDEDDDDDSDLASVGGRVSDGRQAGRSRVEERVMRSPRAKAKAGWCGWITSHRG